WDRLGLRSAGKDQVTLLLRADPVGNDPTTLCGRCSPRLSGCKDGMANEVYDVIALRICLQPMCDRVRERPGRTPWAPRRVWRIKHVDMNAAPARTRGCLIGHALQLLDLVLEVRLLPEGIR